MAGKKILLVDDEKDFVTTVKYFLEINGYEVAVANDGVAGLEKAKESPNLILLDVQMPGLDGFGVLAMLRANPATRRIPTIMLTCKSDTPAIFEAQGARATDYVLKTIALDKLLGLIRRYIEVDKIRPMDI